MTHDDGTSRQHASNGSRTKPASADPLHRVPVFGRLIREWDELRHSIPVVGEHLTRADADALRFQARLLRMAASRLEGRAQQLDRLRAGQKAPEPRRITVE